MKPTSKTKDIPDWNTPINKSVKCPHCGGVHVIKVHAETQFIDSRKG